MNLQQLSAVPCSVTSQMAQKYFMIRFNRHERERKTWWVISAFPYFTRVVSGVPWPPGWCPAVTHTELLSLGMEQAPVCPLPPLKKAAQPPWPSNPSSAGIAKTKAISVLISVDFLSFLIIYSSGDCTCWNFIAWVLWILFDLIWKKEKIAAFKAVEKSLGRWTPNSLAFRPIKKAWHQLSCK